MTTETFTHTIVDCSTGEVSIVPFTEEETAQRLKDIEEAEKYWAEREAQAQAKADAKASALAKLSALGLTEAEAAAIVGN